LSAATPPFDPAGKHPALRENDIPDLRASALGDYDLRRQLVQVEVEGVVQGSPVEVLLNNSHWNGLREGSATSLPGSAVNTYGLPATEAPRTGATELWEIANLTPDAHPLHIHLIQFQVINVQPFLSEHGLCDQFSTARQNFASGQEYRLAWDALFPGGTFNGYGFAASRFIPGFGPPGNYLTQNADDAVGGNLAFNAVLSGKSSAFIGPPLPPDPRDAGWKDTFKLFPCAVTRLAVRWAPQALGSDATDAGTNYFPFDPTSGGPGYAWHCHILDHEDNEMMRPLLLTK
jgi:FtsP/CotA-like multicopper oxidase with cupredoxin domain